MTEGEKCNCCMFLMMGNKLGYLAQYFLFFGCFCYYVTQFCPLCKESELKTNRCPSLSSPPKKANFTMLPHPSNNKQKHNPTELSTWDVHWQNETRCRQEGTWYKFWLLTMKIAERRENALWFIFTAKKLQVEQEVQKSLLIQFILRTACPPSPLLLV